MTSAYADYQFDAPSVWSKIARAARRLSLAGLEATLVAWALAHDPEVDRQSKAKVIAALAYLGMPLDAVPDYLPVVGLTDDVSVLIVAVAAVAFSVRPQHKRFAHDRMRDWGLS